MSPRPLRSTPFPYTTLFRSPHQLARDRGLTVEHAAQREAESARVGLLQQVADRKSTRLNSSHVEISYAVFCLKKKKGQVVSADGAPRQTADCTLCADPHSVT